MKTEMKIYHNPSYTEYDGGDCYLIYLMDGIMFLNTPKDTFKVLQRPKPHPDTERNIAEEDLDTYASCRGFEKVVDVERNAYSMESPKIEWFNDYNLQPKRGELKSRLIDINYAITSKNRYKYPSSGYVTAAYQILSCFIQKL